MLFRCSSNTFSISASACSRDLVVILASTFSVSGLIALVLMLIDLSLYFSLIAISCCALANPSAGVPSSAKARPTQSLSAIDDATVSASEICDSLIPNSAAFALILSLATTLNAGATRCGAAGATFLSPNTFAPYLLCQSSGVMLKRADMTVALADATEAIDRASDSVYLPAATN